MRARCAFEPEHGEAEHDPKRENRNRIDAVPRVAEVRSGRLEEIALFLDGELERQVNITREGGLAGPLSRVHFVRIDLICIVWAWGEIHFWGIEHWLGKQT